MKNDIQERRIGDILNSTEGMHRAKAPDALFHAIEGRINAQVKRIVPLRTIIAAAASILLLLSVNVYLILHTTKKESISKQDMNAVIKYYNLDEQRVNLDI